MARVAVGEGAGKTAPRTRGSGPRTTLSRHAPLSAPTAYENAFRVHGTVEAGFRNRDGPLPRAHRRESTHTPPRSAVQLHCIDYT